MNDDGKGVIFVAWRIDGKSGMCAYTTTVFGNDMYLFSFIELGLELTCCV